MGAGRTAGVAGEARSVARRAVGIALAQGWLPMVAVGTSAYEASQDLGHALAPLWAGFFAGELTALALTAATARRPPAIAGRQVASRPTAPRPISPVAGLALATFGYLLMIVTYSVAATPGGDWRVGLLAALAWSLVGLGSGSLFVAWAATTAPSTATGVAPCVGAWVGATLTVMMLLPIFGVLGHSVWASLAGAVLTAGSLALLRLDRATASRDAEAAGARAPGTDVPGDGHPTASPALSTAGVAPATRDHDTFPLRALAAGLTIGLTLSLMLGQFLGAPFARALPSTWAFGLAGAVLAAAVQVALRLARGAWRPLDACWACAAAIVVAFYPLDAGSAFSLHYATAAGTLACAMTLATMPPAVAQSALASGRDPWRCQLLALLGLVASAAAGAPVGLAAATSPLGGTAVYPSAIAAMILGFVALVLLVRPEGGRGITTARPDSGIAPDAPKADAPRDAVATACAAIARQGGLTARELDVLVILAHGHGAARVQEELGISEGTALTHRRHIYEKLRVHTRADLLDLVARVERDGTH